MAQKNLSTGVLAKDITIVFAGVTLVNLDPDDTMAVSVFVFDWSSGSPVALPTSIPNPIILPPNTSNKIIANLNTASFYEIRIISPVENDLVFNCYGLTNTPFVIGQGNTVLNSGLTQVELI